MARVSLGVVMRRLGLLLCGAIVCAGIPLSGAAWAANPASEIDSRRPVIAPAPSWVAPAAIPPAPSQSDGAATISLLTDVQKKLTNDGDASYLAMAYKITAPQGLDGAALQVGWDPALETLTIHRYRILRDGKTIDLLGDGSKLSIIQRETNLERASLDGELTATMQPDDVRVGDIIDFAFTKIRRDPAMRGKSEAFTGPRDGETFGRFRIRFLWSDSKKMRWQAFPGIVQPKLTHSAEGTELLADLANFRTALPPKNAPARFMTINAIEVSDFPDWAAVSSSILPFYSRAIALEDKSPVRIEAQRIASETSDPKLRAELALALVQEKIRYLYLNMGDGGFLPAAADLTWSRRYGDCKAKTVLLVALLRELGIEADPVLVNTERGDLVRTRLPTIGSFDHVIVRTQIGGRTYWMDGTRLGDNKLSLLPIPAYQVGLPVAANAKGLVALNPEPLGVPSETLSLNLDASAGIEAPALAKGEMRFRGSEGVNMRMKYAGLEKADRDQQLRELWRKFYSVVSPTSITTTFDSETGDFVVAMVGTAKMDWSSEAGTRWYEVDRSRLGWTFDADREGAINKDAPFQVDYPDFWESTETIKLPAGGEGFTLQGGSVDQVVGGVYAFHRKVGIDGGVVKMESSTKVLAPELPYNKVEQVKRDMAALSSNGVYVRLPEDYMATPADIAALQGDKTALAAALVRRGALRFDRNQLAEAVADEDAALALDPKNADAHAVRALALAVQGNPKAGEAADRALSLDSKQVLAWRAKSIVAFKQKKYAEADDLLSKTLEISPENGQALAARASARLLLGQFETALSDADAALAIKPWAELRIVRAGALMALGRTQEALAEVDRAILLAPKNEEVRKARAELRAEAGEQVLARDDYSALISQSPKEEYYLARASLWPASDRVKRNDDIAAALRLNPRSIKGLAFRASAAIDDGNFARAESDILDVERLEPKGVFAYQLRLQLLQKQGRGRDALKLIDQQVAKNPTDAGALNERCWIKATFNIELETALADCNASLKLRPGSAASLDSRAFANLRLGATDAAIEDYNTALKLAPKLPASLYGRAIARARKGDSNGANADMAEARKLSPEIDKRFGEFGISLPPGLAPPPKTGGQTSSN